MRRLGPPPISARRPEYEAPHRTGAVDTVIYRQLTNALASAAATHARGRLVDIGCGRKPWADLFGPYVSEHIGVDHPDSVNPTGNVDVFATAYAVPLPDGHATTVLMTEVLEHLEDPVRALREAHRLLEPGGRIIVTTPLLWPVHEAPRDFFRYTPHGLRHVLGSAGFVEVDVTPLSGVWTALAAVRGESLKPYRKGPVRWVVDGYTAATQHLAIAMDRVHFWPDFSWNHLATASKPPAESAGGAAVE